MGMPAAALELGRGPSTVYGDPYPYTQTLSDPGGSFDVIMQASLDSGPAQLYVSDKFDSIGIMKSASGASTSDERQINADEFLEMTITNLSGGSVVQFTQLSGAASYFDPGDFLYLYKNDVLVNTIACDGSGSYAIVPPIIASEGDTVSFNPSANVRLVAFEVNIESYEPYIADGTPTAVLLDTVVGSEGHYYVTADLSGLAHKPDGVVAKVINGSTGGTLYVRGAVGPDTSEIDFDLLVLQPGDTVEVLAGLTGDAGEDPGLWSVSLDRYDSWSGSRYTVPVVPLALAAPTAGLDMYRDAWPKNSGFRNDYRGGQGSMNNYVAEALGHAPKCYGEELSGSWQNLSPMDSYAQSHPEWQAIVHWNGKMFRPQFSFNNLPDKISEFKPYHFRYEVGTYLSSAIIASDTQITVDDPGVFYTNQYNAVIIIPVDPVTGDRQFDDAELVTVTAISGNQLTVSRNLYQSKFGYTSAGNFAAGSYIAPAAQRLSPGWVDNGGLRWNLSLSCPVDEFGRNGADMLAEMLSYEFAAGNNLERFHGIMFDVLDRTADADEDCDLDGNLDAGFDSRGIDLFHLGVQGMARKLRAALPHRILTFDGQSDTWPALQTVFNGIESEGFSRYNDSYTKRWSKALNYYLFTEQWNPSSNFWNFCVTKQNDNPPAAEERPLMRFHMAGLTAMGVAVNHANVEDGGGTIHALDEIRKGEEGVFQWLGAPVGGLVRPGLSASDELGGASLPAAGWSSPDGSATVTASGADVLVEPVDTGVEQNMVIEFSGISIPEGDLLIRFEGKGGLKHLPSDTARAINIEVDGRVQNGLTYDTLTGVVNNDGFTEVTAFYRSAGAPGGDTVTLRLIIEGASDMTLRNFTFHNATDTLVREFENGIVLCNPSENPHTFDLATLFPGQNFKRILGQSYDDPVVNDGSAVGSSVQLDGYRGLFLIKDIEVVSVVNFDRTGLGNVGGRNPDANGQNSAVWNFSDTEPLITAAQGTNAVVYGGIFDTWSVAASYTPQLRFYQGVEIQNQVLPSNGSDTTATGMLVWKKEDFLNGVATQTVSFASGSTLSCSVNTLAGSGEVRFIVKQDGSYHVSAASATASGAFAVDPSATDWAPISTADYSIGSYAPNSFSNVQAVGLYYSTARNGNQSNVRLGEFRFSVPVTGLTISEPPPVYVVGIGPGGSGEMVLSWLAAPGTSYQLQGRSNLVEGVWENIGDPVLGSGGDMSITNVPSLDAGFYRIIVE